MVYVMNSDWRGDPGDMSFGELTHAICEARRAFSSHSVSPSQDTEVREHAKAPSFYTVLMRANSSQI